MFELVERQRVRVADHATFGSAKRDIRDGGLPGHVHRERPRVVQRHSRVVAQPALRGAARNVVLHAKAREDPERSVVHLHREMHGELAFHFAQHRTNGVIKPEGVGGGVELPLSNAQGGALIRPGHAQAALYATARRFRLLATPRIRHSDTPCSCLPWQQPSAQSLTITITTSMLWPNDRRFWTPPVTNNKEAHRLWPGPDVGEAASRRPSNAP